MMKILPKYAKQFDVVLLIIGHVVGFNMFVALKLIGINEEFFNLSEFEFNWALPTISSLLIGISLAILNFNLFDSLSKKYKFFIYIFFRRIISLIVIISWIYIIKSIKSYIDGYNIEKVIQQSNQFIISPIALSIYFVMLILSEVLNFFRLLGNHFGHGILFNFIIGKYKQPQEEERTFLFIDLKGSTKLAEQLGHIKYSRFINKCFNDLAEIVEKYDAEIYQYVGDEAVLTWLNNKHKVPQSAFHFYFDYAQLLESKSEDYLQKFDLVPQFKAALHSGNVMVTEIGNYRKELAYHGDVLNTTSRILELCSRYKKNFLVSEEAAIHIENCDSFRLTNFKEVILRGKNQMVDVFEVERIEEKSII